MTIELSPYRTAAEVVDIADPQKNIEELVDQLIQWVESTEPLNWRISCGRLQHNDRDIHLEKNGWNNIVIFTGRGESVLTTTKEQKRRIKKFWVAMKKRTKDEMQKTYLKDVIEKISRNKSKPKPLAPMCGRCGVIQFCPNCAGYLISREGVE